MTPTASPRHPWKALAVVIAMFAAVHGARAHVGGHPHGFTHVHFADAAAAAADCPDDVDVDVDEDDGSVIDVFDALDTDDAD
jgi:hypothetical protein